MCLTSIYIVWNFWPKVHQCPQSLSRHIISAVRSLNLNFFQSSLRVLILVPPSFCFYEWCLNVLCSHLNYFEVLVLQFKRPKCLRLAKKNTLLTFLQSLTFAIHHQLLSLNMHTSFPFQLLVCFSPTASSLPPVFTCPVLSGVSRYSNTSLHVSQGALAVLPHYNHVLILISLSKSCEYILQTMLSSKSYLSKLCFQHKTTLLPKLNFFLPFPSFLVVRKLHSCKCSAILSCCFC